MRVGKWISFDEQMVKCTALFSRSIQRYNPLKSIKHGEIGFGMNMLTSFVSTAACKSDEYGLMGDHSWDNLVAYVSVWP